MVRSKERDIDPIAQLIAGYRLFRGGEAIMRQIVNGWLISHAWGSRPGSPRVACCDSRVDLAVITASPPGELFVIRNVANLVPPYEGEGVWHGTSAALQFAVCSLEVKHLIVMGHARCGGIRSMVEGQENKHGDRFLAAWMSIVYEAHQRALAKAELQTLDERSHACEQYAIEISLANLETFPWIRERVEQHRLQLHGWYYDIMSGDLLGLDATGRGFRSL